MRTFTIRQTKVGVEQVVGKIELEGKEVGEFVFQLEFAMNQEHPEQRVHIHEADVSKD